jgi:hypothetical protein
MTQLIASLLPYIIVGLFGLALILFLLSFQQLRRGRTGQYWRLRRAAGQRGGQLFLASITLFGIAAALALFTGLADLAYNRLQEALNRDPNAPKGVALPTQTAIGILPSFTLLPSATTTRTPTATPTIQTLTPTATSSSPPTATSVPTETLTPTVSPTASPTFGVALALTPQTSNVSVPRGASLEIASVARDISPDEEPIEPGVVFEAGTQRLYVFFEYRQMASGVAWTRALLRDGVPVQGQSYRWGQTESGSGYFFFGNAEGYPPGEYEIKLFIGLTEVSSYHFTIASPGSS